MTRKFRRTLWIALVLPSVLAAAILLSTPRTVQTCTMEQRCGSEFYHYSDSTYTELVGIRQWDCDCNYSEWGETTNYIQWLPSPCCQ